MKVKLVLLFVFCAVLCFSQSTTDSLWQVLSTLEKQTENYTTDTSKIKVLNYLAAEQSDEKVDTALGLSFRALKISEQIKWEKGMVQSLLAIANLYKNKSNYPMALEYYLKTLTATEQLEKNTAPDKMKKIIRNKAVVLFNIAVIFNEQGDNKKSLSYYSKALGFAHQIQDSSLYGPLYGNIGNCYTDMLAHDSAIAYYNKALVINKKLNNIGGMNNNWGNMGSAYNNQGNHKKALECYLATRDFIEKEGENVSRAILYANLGHIYLQTKNYKEAEDLLLQSVELSEKANFFRSLSYAHQTLSALYDSLGNPKKALNHFKKFVSTRDSIVNEQNIKKQTQAELEYEFQKKEFETQAEQDIKDALAAQEKLLSESRIFWIEMACASIILALITIAVVLYKRFKSNQKTSREFAAKNNLIEEKQKQILDSIQYAKRIQQSLLPTEKYIERKLKELKK